MRDQTGDELDIVIKEDGEYVELARDETPLLDHGEFCAVHRHEGHTVIHSDEFHEVVQDDDVPSVGSDEFHDPGLPLWMRTFPDIESAVRAACDCVVFRENMNPRVAPQVVALPEYQPEYPSRYFPEPYVGVVARFRR